MSDSDRFQQNWMRWLPFLSWLPLLTRANIRADTMAGITGAIVALPQGVAFATIAGMPPQYGLYAAMIPAIIAALFGSSWHLVSGPTTAASIVLFSALSSLAEPGTAEYVKLALTLTFMVGVIELAMGLARLGMLVNFISHSVIIGFTAGAAILIASSQIKHFFGVEIERGSHFYEIFIQLFEQLDQIDPWIVLVGSITLLTGIVFKRYWRQVPYMIAAMLMGSLAALVINAINPGAVTTVGALPASLPPLSAPDFSLETIRALAPAAFATTLFALTEAVSIARSLAVRSGQHISGNQEFIGQGLSNIVGSFFSAYVATGSFNRSGVNFEAGAKTPLAAVIAGGLLVLIVLLVAPYAAYLPNAAMAGILFLVAWGLIDFHHIDKIFKASSSDSAVMVTTFAATLLLELEFAILLGVVLSLVFYLGKTSRPLILPRVPDPNDPNRKFVSDPELPECPQLKIVRIDGSLFFGAVNHVAQTFMEFRKNKPDQRFMLLIAPGINFLDVAGAEFLALEAKRRYAEGGKLFIYRLKRGALDPLRDGRYMQDIGVKNLYASKTQAICEITAQLDHDVCANCSQRIFKECANLPGSTGGLPQA